MEKNEQETIIKLIVLTNNLKLISQVEQVGADIGEPDCKLTKPYEVVLQEDGKLFLRRWLEGFASDDAFMMSSDKILTLSEPTMQILDSYKGLI
jgi:hypothetical protein|tara:strand:+ start:36 stop:317 length:282 start_codon:yes stop_codon:yes gene_type:complete